MTLYSRASKIQGSMLYNIIFYQRMLDMGYFIQLPYFLTNFLEILANIPLHSYFLYHLSIFLSQG